MPKLFYTICPFVCSVALVFGTQVFADCGQPHESGQTGSTDSGSSSTGSGSTTGNSVSTSPTGGGSLTTEQHLGATFDPAAQGAGKDGALGPSTFNSGGGGRKTPEELDAQFLKNFKVDPFMWRSSVKYIKEMSDLLKAREEARINEAVRKGSLENASGLTHARERYKQTKEKSLEAYNKYWDAERKVSNAISARSRWDERQRNAEIRSQRAPTEEMREAAKQELKSLEGEKEGLSETMQSALKERVQADKVYRELFKQEMERMNEVSKAMERYQQMEAHYNDAIRATPPQPTESGR